MQDQHQQAADYIQQLRSRGYTDDVIKQQLISAGWTLTNVEQLMIRSGSADGSARSNAKTDKKVLFIILVAVLFLSTVASGTVWLHQRNNNKATVGNTHIESNDNTEAGSHKVKAADLQTAVNTYCTDLAKAYGFSDVKTGYIISERFSEEILRDSPELLRLKQIGNAATATVDCESQSRGGLGISNDLLFIEQDNKWRYVEEVQNNAGSGFTCATVEKYKVSTELVSKCAKTAGAKAETRE